MNWKDITTEVVALIVLGVIAGAAIFYLRGEAKQIVSSIAGGIVGYLTRAAVQEIRNSQL